MTATARTMSYPGYVYIIRENRTGLFKIGITRNPDRRMQQLRVGTTATLLAMTEYSDPEGVERDLHYHHRHHRIPQTEYFCLDQPPALPVLRNQRELDEMMLEKAAIYAEELRIHQQKGQNVKNAVLILLSSLMLLPFAAMLAFSVLSSIPGVQMDSKPQPNYPARGLYR